MASLLQQIELDEVAYIELLRKLISVADKVQNAPDLGLVPQENVVSDFVLAELEPYTTKHGGFLSVERVEFVAGRGNVIIKYQHPDFADSKQTLAFVGSHLDVVPANPEGWARDPFTLSVEGDKLYGRGTTDCLGHVALMTQLFLQLAKNKVPTKTQVVAVLIASEENGEIPGVGVETLMESGKIDFIKNGPVIWVDCSDSQPCIGTAGAITWSLKATGKLFHSGLPNLGINGLELGMDALVKIQERFYKDFGPLEQEREYNFSCPSTMKPTRIESSTNGLNQIPPWVKISGDVRLSPFYEMKDLISKVQSYVDDLNKDLTVLEGLRGPSSKYTLPAENLTGKLEFSFDKHYFEGIACSLESVGFKSLEGAITTVLGQAKPFSISGSLPLVRDLQRAGLDLTLIGFGKSAVYHGDNEYCSLTDMKNAIKILAHTIINVDESHA
ncbi:Acetylornithine deacetylase, partial [Globisporangium splendens]